MGTIRDITNINTIDEDALCGEAGGAAVLNDVNNDLGQVARRRVGALAAMMGAVVCRDAAVVMTDAKIAVPSSGMGPGEGLALGGGAATIWTVKVCGCAWQSHARPRDMPWRTRLDGPWRPLP